MEGLVYFYLICLVLSAIVCYRGCRYDIMVKGLNFTVKDLIIYSLLIFVPLLNCITIIAGVFLASKEIFHPYKFKFLDKTLIKGNKK